MRFIVHLTATVLLVAMGIGGMTSAKAADYQSRDVRNSVIGRQKIREELAADLAKGYLTRMDQYRILLHAKEVLAPDDLQGLEKTLDRIAKQQSGARSAAVATLVPASTTAEPASTRATAGRSAREPAQENSQSEEVTPSKYEEPAARLRAAMAANREPSAGGARPNGEDPSAEETPVEIGKPTMQMEGDNQEECGCDEECRPHRRWFAVEAFSGIDAFKGPLDIGNANGNFGMRLGVNGAVTMFQRLGIGLQAGFAADLTNLKGSPYPVPNSTIRDQIFATVGMFQRINRGDCGSVTWGFAYDWLFDDYYSNFHFGQWRVKGEYEFDPSDAVGIQASLPEHGSTGTIPNFFGGVDVLHFKPITQGYLYWTHTFCNDASLTGRAGVAERPGEFVFGGAGRVPLTENLAMVGDYSYIMPNASGGAIAQTQEIWNVSLGIEFVPGGFGRCGAARFRPFMPVADNGSLAVHEIQ